MTSGKYPWRGVLAAGRWCFPVTPFPPTSKAERHDKSEILLEVAIKPTPHKPPFVQNLLFIMFIIELSAYANILFTVLNIQLKNILIYQRVNQQQKQEKQCNDQKETMRKDKHLSSKHYTKNNV